MCVHPNMIKRILIHRTGEFEQSFCGRMPDYLIEHPDLCIEVHRDYTIEYLPVACQNCIECYACNTTTWAYRCALEYGKHKTGCILTLTYDPEHLPVDGALHKCDYQNFLRDLRKKIYPVRVRYFVSGEYGSLRHRPHFHMILFGWCPNDLVFYSRSKAGNFMYNSAFLSSVWKRGFVTIERFTLNGARYSAKYFQKYLFGDLTLKDPLYDMLQRPFVAMSTHPGIGAGCKQELSCLDTDKIYVDGHWIPAPRYFLKRADYRQDPRVDDVRMRRIEYLRTFSFDRFERDKKIFRLYQKKS